MVRPRAEQDIRPLLAILRAVHWPNDPARWLVGTGTLGAWVVHREGALAGHVALTAAAAGRAWPEWHQALGVAPERLAVLRRLFVHPDVRRGGLATRLVAHAEREAAARGLHPVLDVAADGSDAAAFWERRGYRRAGEARLPAGDQGRALRVLLLVGGRAPYPGSPAPSGQTL